jgi:hypothetical protein
LESSLRHLHPYSHREGPLDPRTGEDKKSSVSGIFIRILTERDLWISLRQVSTKGAQSPTPSPVVRGAAGSMTGEEGGSPVSSIFFHAASYGGRISDPEAEFFDEILKFQEFSSLLFTVTSTLQLCLEISISSNLCNLLQFLEFSYCAL